jgi:hypothetical protein
MFYALILAARLEHEKERNRMPQVTFTNEEYTALTKAAEKLMQARKDMPPQQWKKPQNKAVRNFAKKFTNEQEEASEGQTRILDRTDLRLIQELGQASARALYEGIIPEYAKRISSQPDKVDYYKPYQEKAERMYALWTAIVNKIEEAL